MTDAAAWALLAEKLEDPLQEMTALEMHTPVGTGWVMKISMPHLGSHIYVKFEFISIKERDVICGRSFHL